MIGKTAAVCLMQLLFLPVFAQEAQVDEYKDAVDQAIEKGLTFLASKQKTDGRFEGQFGETAALPALVGMAFLSKGYVPDREPYGEVINRCIDRVLELPDMRSDSQARGYLSWRNDGKMYSHSIGTLFISEVSGMVDEKRQKRIDETLPLMVKVILDAQNRQKNDDQAGGWRYEPTSGDSDLSCSGWALMALRSARLNGGAVPPEAIEKAVQYVKRRQSNDGAFNYQGQYQNRETLTGAGILCLELCGRHNDPATLRAVSYITDVYPKKLTGDDQCRCLYGLYYTSQGLFQIGGTAWKDFFDWMCGTWLPKQNADGSFVARDNEERSQPVYSTAMALLALTVPYRQLPIYQRDETVDE